MNLPYTSMSCMSFTNDQALMWLMFILVYSRRKVLTTIKLIQRSIIKLYFLKDLDNLENCFKMKEKIENPIILLNSQSSYVIIKFGWNVE